MTYLSYCGEEGNLPARVMMLETTARVVIILDGYSGIGARNDVRNHSARMVPILDGNSGIGARNDVRNLQRAHGSYNRWKLRYRRA